ncbi:Sulfate transport system permease protein CysT [gamma proteobacterium IMCC2047]|nr:Sulfate transport system permease protein CysT [gamma proteobacterium IMCC2047]
MYFDSFADFIAMGGHAKYVWIAYGLAVLIFVINLISPIFKRKRVIAQQVRQLRREEIHASDS